MINYSRKCNFNKGMAESNVEEDVIRPFCPFGTPCVMGAIKSLGCNWWSYMHQIDT